VPSPNVKPRIVTDTTPLFLFNTILTPSLLLTLARLPHHEPIQQLLLCGTPTGPAGRLIDVHVVYFFRCVVRLLLFFMFSGIFSGFKKEVGENQTSSVLSWTFSRTERDATFMLLSLLFIVTYF